MTQHWLDLEHQYLAQGWTGTNSKRASQYVLGVYPTHLKKGDGPYVWDVDGKKYIDFVCGLGAILLGYNNRKVNERVLEQMKDGPIFSLPHPLEVIVAEKLRDMIPQMEKVRFLKTGNEACLASVRIARTCSRIHGGSTLLAVEGYHGHGDLWTGLTPPAFGISDDHDAYKMYYDEGVGGGEIFITEPVMLDASPGRKEQLVSYMKSAGVTIFDEIVTGGRVPKLTVAGWWGLKPDIMCLGKGLANGFPLSVVGGTKEIMDCGEYFISSTFSGECISLAACLGTLEELGQRNIADLFYYGERFQKNFRKEVEGLGVRLEGYGTRAMLNVTHPETALLMQECCKSGILFGKAFFYNFAHMENGVDEFVLNVVSDVSGRIRRKEVKLEGKPPEETFKR